MASSKVRILGLGSIVIPFFFLFSHQTVVQVPAGADLQQAINSASTGDTLQLANSTYTCNCVDNKGLTILGPARIVTPNADPAIAYPPGTPPAVLRNLEITTTVGWPQVFSIIRYGDGGTAQDTFDEEPQGLTIDNVWVHGQTSQEIQRCVAANGRSFRFVNSRATDCHGRGYDSQAIASWNGSGPFTILDSYLEGAGENVMFGGSPPSIPNLIHTGIEVRRNHFFKPLSWKGVWTVKNLFELKNARNVIVDGNVFENNWTDAQAGRAIVFTPRPSDSGSWAVVEDVQFTNNTIKNVGSGLLLLGADEAPAPTETRLKRVRIANNLWLVDGPGNESNGACFTVINKTEDVTLERNTCVQTGNIIIADYAPNIRFIYTGNISRHNDYGVIGSGRSIGNDSINFYFPGAVFTNNAIAKEVNPPSNVESIYPAGNQFPATLSAAIDGSYRSLIAGIGVDINALLAAQGGGTPSPTPTPTATATPVPTATPLPTVDPSPSPTPLPPCTMNSPSSISVPPNGIGQIGVSLNSMAWQPTAFTVWASSNIPGQVSVFPASQNVVGTSAVVTFGVKVKRKSATITFSSPCGSGSTVVLIQ